MIVFVNKQKKIDEKENIDVRCSDGSGARNRNFGYQKSVKKWISGKLNKAIPSYFANFLA